MVYFVCWSDFPPWTHGLKTELVLNCADMKVEVSHGDPKPEKLSLRKELKRKQQEQFMTPEKGKEGIVLDDSFRSTLTSTPTGEFRKKILYTLPSQSTRL